MERLRSGVKVFDTSNSFTLTHSRVRDGSGSLPQVKRRCYASEEATKGSHRSRSNTR